MPTTADQTPLRVRGGRRAELAAELARQFRSRRPRPTISVLAASCGRRPGTVRRLLEEAGVRSRRALLGFSKDALAAAVVARHQAGDSVSQLAADTGIDERAIRDYLRAAGEELKQRRRRADLRMTTKELSTAYTAGVDLQPLADRAGSSYGTVRRILLEAGVRLRPRGGRSS